MINAVCFSAGSKSLDIGPLGKSTTIRRLAASVRPTPATRANFDSALLRALARGFRWRRLLETGDYSAIEQVAEAKNMNPSCVSRGLRMTLLVPDIVEAILAGRQPQGLTMRTVMNPFQVSSQ